MSRKLEVPYRSQRDSDALYAPSDCGAACVGMLLKAYGMDVTIDAIFRATGQPQQNFLSRGDLIKAANKYQVSLRRFSGGDQDYLKRRIDENRPVIALVNYKAWSTPGSGVTTMSTFTKTHFVVVTGYDGDDILINDPLWWGSRRLEGKDKRMTYPQFAAAWGTCHEFLNNPDFIGLVTMNPLPGHSAPVSGQPVTEDEVNKILAWGVYMGISINEEKLSSRAVVDVYLSFVGDWGKNPIDHIVQQGDDLGILSLRYYGDPMKWKVITYFNDLPPIDAFQVGDTLKIPEPKFT
ncbi:MAG: C39 family peptidase [Anaerolineales bacterium]|nr:C39 family peptidase [Anaerolineales bacterium]